MTKLKNDIMVSMASFPRVQLGTFLCFLTLTTATLKCRACSRTSTASSYARPRIRSSTQQLCGERHDGEHFRTAQFAKFVLDQLYVRGGAADDDYRRRSDGRPPPPPHSQRSDREVQGVRPGSRPDPSRRTGYREPIGQRYQPDFEDLRRDDNPYDKYDLDERTRRHDDGGRWEYEDVNRGPNRNLGPERNARNKMDPTATEGKKGWFGSKRSKGPGTEETLQQQPPPPPPPPIFSGTDYNPSESERVPIHYRFPVAEVLESERTSSDEMIPDLDLLSGQGLPIEDEDDQFARVQESRKGRRRWEDDDDPYASPRRDAVTMYMSSRLGAAKVRFGSIVVGAALGGFIGKSLMNDAFKMSVIMAGILFIAGFLRNDYGELSRALGLAFLLTLQRTGNVRKQYPTMPHLKAMIRQAPRKPFPPVEEGSSPWRYEPVYEDDPDFKMTYALLAMAMVGSFCGGNVPLIPAWLGGIIGAVLFASFTSGSNARGDLGRTMGMRVVGMIQLVLSINSELRILSKAGTVGGLIFDKIMIMDRKHRIKDKIIALCRWAYDKVSNTAAEMQADLNEDRSKL
ncbi:hypothetical protein HJC23_008435 [Cyclotella cryptica]|uniref:Uncharacterized protein n=1 Tax=Cyclotella cryptica TaxID=29204 RepID=A0ABD3PX76_9STRA|eukprot:CCRYP_010722-RA/>CCRYP_010722-RA protein AED:0.53 eAED:0.34 QI:0/0/0/1/1/1/2/0/570